MWQLTSPAGRYEITLSEREAFNSHWVHTPTLVDKHTGETLLALGSSWSLDESAWQSDSIVALTVRKYPGNHSPPDVVAMIDCDGRTAQVGEGAPVSLAELERRLDAALSWIHAQPRPAAGARTGLIGVLRRLFEKL